MKMWSRRGQSKYSPTKGGKKVQQGVRKTERLTSSVLELWPWVRRIVSHRRATTTQSVSMPFSSFLNALLADVILPNRSWPVIRTWSARTEHEARILTLGAASPLLYAPGVRREQPPCASRRSKSSTVPWKPGQSPFLLLSRLHQTKAKLSPPSSPILALRHRVASLGWFLRVLVPCGKVAR